MKKRFCILLAVLIALLIPASCFAETAMVLNLQNVAVQNDNSLKMNLYSPADPTINDITAAIDGVSLNISSVSGYSDGTDGTSWIVLIDTSSVSTTTGDEPITGFLNQFLDEIKLYPNNNAAIIRTGTALNEIALLDVSQEGNVNTLKNTIKSFTGDYTKTTLNATISTALDFLNSSTSVRPRTCLVVMSRGTTNDATGATTTELLNKIADSSTTVYTVAFNSSESAVSNYFSLARSSVGGTGILSTGPWGTAARRDEAASIIVNQIKSNEKYFRTVNTAPISGLTSCNELSVTVNTPGFALKDTYTFTPAERSKLMSGSNIGGNVGGGDNPGGDIGNDIGSDIGNDIGNDIGGEDFEPKLNLETILIIAIAVLVVVCIIIVIAMLTRKKKPAVSNESVPPSAPIPGSAPGPYGPPASITPSYPPASPTEAANELPPMPGQPPVPPQTQLRITLMEISPNAGTTYIASMTTQLLVGRDPARVHLVISPDDHKISGAHFKLQYTQGTMFIEDISRNGTKVNEIRIQRITQLHQQDVLGIGTSRFKIMWTVG